MSVHIFCCSSPQCHASPSFHLDWFLLKNLLPFLRPIDTHLLPSHSSSFLVFTSAENPIPKRNKVPCACAVSSSPHARYLPQTHVYRRIYICCFAVGFVCPSLLYPRQGNSHIITLLLNRSWQSCENQMLFYLPQCPTSTFPHVRANTHSSLAYDPTSLYLYRDELSGLLPIAG